MMFGPDPKHVCLELLAELGGWQYGMALIKASSGRLGRGTVYVHLSSLEDAGQVESKLDPDHIGPGLPRRLYRITNSGRHVFAGVPGLVLA